MGQPLRIVLTHSKCCFLLTLPALGIFFLPCGCTKYTRLTQMHRVNLLIHKVSALAGTYLFYLLFCVQAL